MNVLLSDVAKEFANVIQDQRGDDTSFSSIGPAGNCSPGDLVFAEDKALATAAVASSPSGIVIPEALAELVGTPDGTGILISNNVRLAHALIKQRYGDREWDDDKADAIHPAAVIHADATVPGSSRVYANAVIGDGVVLGERCRVLEGVVIENGATLGDDCVIHPNAVIGYECELGNEVLVGPGTIIGSEGYGFSQDAEGKSHRLPQTGNVVIEDRVRIGANTCIDRAAYGSTRIGAGTKIDNLCHIAHAVEVGEDCLLTAMLCCAGSTKIGDRVMTSGQTGILGHLTITNDVVLAHRAAVLQDVDEPGGYGGLPLQPLKNHLKTAMQLKKLGDYSKKLRELEREINALKAGD
jgi:UDP-3-O-[3-hydroxymyristoyl] glucosamine N-acyltransferase